MRAFATPLVAAALMALPAFAVDDCPPHCPNGTRTDEPEQAEMRLTLEEQKALYEKITGPYCDENALLDPLCMHKQDEWIDEYEAK